MQCPRCQSDSPPGQKFCGACGTSLMAPYHTSHLEILHTVASTISRSLDVEEVLTTALRALTYVTGHEISSLHMPSPDGHTLHLRGQRGMSDELRDMNLILPIGEGLIGKVAASGQGVVLEEVTRSPDLLPAARRAVERDGIRAFVCVPISVHRRTLGTLALGRRIPGAFTPSDVCLLEAAADQIGIALDNARLYHEAAEANRTKDEFLAMLSHELRTPLQSILGWIGLLRRASAAPAQMVHGLAVIERNVRVQMRLISDLLDVSRIVAGKLKMERRHVDLAIVIETALESLGHDIQAKNLRVEATLNRGSRILGDPVRLAQVVVNLVSNAVKFTPSGGRIIVGLECGDRMARITVTDTGQGIDPELLPRIFDRFRQADSSSKRAQGGLGLGLTIVRHLVEGHGGTVHVESRGQDKGSTFVVELPVVLSGAEGARTEGAEEGHQAWRAVAGRPSLSGIGVLVVEDDRDSLEFITALLREQGAEVHEAVSVDAALALLHTTPFDVLLSDIGMPGADGYDLLRALRAIAQAGVCASPVAIALTGFAAAEDRERAYAAGFDIHVSKPVGCEDLLDVVLKAIGRRSGP
jgi:signal transduction histidine kinase/CheY-like chemotaxis protein